MSGPDGARLRCVFQRLNANVTTQRLWLASTKDGAKGEPFRVTARALGRTATAWALVSKEQLRTAPLRQGQLRAALVPKGHLRVAQRLSVGSPAQRGPSVPKGRLKVMAWVSRPCRTTDLSLPFCTNPFYVEDLQVNVGFAVRRLAFSRLRRLAQVPLRNRRLI